MKTTKPERREHLASFRLLDEPHGYGESVVGVEMTLVSKEEAEDMVLFMSHKQVDKLYRDVRERRGYIKPFSSKAKEKKI